jgi:Zn-dependent alcohol dehydrogenase
VLKAGPEDSLVLFGLGSVGIAGLMAAGCARCGRITAVDVVSEELEMAKELGAADVINSREKGNVVEEIQKLTGGRGATMAVDCTGILKVIEDMVESIGPEGLAVLVGVPRKGRRWRLIR